MMWTRKQLKDKAKTSFKANYWKTVLVGLIILVLAGGLSVGTSAARGTPFLGAPGATSTHVDSHTPDNVDVQVDDGHFYVDVDDPDGKVHVDINADDAESLGELVGQYDRYGIDEVNAIAAPAAIMVGLTVLLVLLVVIAITIVVYAFLLNPLEVGAQRFLVRNLNQRAEVKEVAYAYDNNYLETVKTIFLRDLFIILWSLLLIIPGIYKSYQYRMIPYLMAEDPTMTKDRAFAESKRMMDGQKWNAFVLDLSFLGWNILSVLTLGILGVFYVGPYQAQTNAALYEALRYGPSEPEADRFAQPTHTAPVAGAAAAYPAANPNAQAMGAQVIAPATQPPVPAFAAVDPTTPMVNPAELTSPMANPSGTTAPMADLAEATAPEAAMPAAAAEVADAADAADAAEAAQAPDGANAADAAENDAATDSHEA